MSRGATPAGPAGVIAHVSPVGAHVGLAFADDVGVFVIDQAWHFQTRCQEFDAFVESSPVPVLWSRPGFDNDSAEDLATIARLVARRLVDNQLPYALALRDAHMDEDGVIDLRASLGLSCSSFLVVMFRAARVPLLDLTTWEAQRTEARRSEDSAAQTRIVEFLRPRHREHAQRVEAEVGCTRIRAEEVAAGSTFEQRPVTLRDTEARARVLLTLLNFVSPAPA